MRAIVVATGNCPAMQDFTHREPAVLLPVAGKPFLHYVIEYLVDSGITSIDFILSELPEEVELSLGDGTRWGSKFRFHLARDPGRPYGRLAALAGSGDEPVVLAHGDRLPLWAMNGSQPRTELVLHKGEWTGWGVQPASALRRATDQSDEAALAATLEGPPASAELLLSVRTPEEFLEANWAMIEKRFPKVLMTGREAGDRIWISRNVSLHPTAQLTAPVYIAENCRINAGVRLGPMVVVAANCLVDDESILSETVVFPGSYIGQGLELNGAIVDRNRLANVKVGAAITVADNFILGSFVENRLGLAAKRTVSRLTGLFLLVLLWPLLLLTWFWRLVAAPGPAIRRKASVRLPAPDGLEFSTFDLISFCGSPEAHKRGGRAHEFFLHFLPGVINAALGHLSFVGVAPRSPEEIEALPHDWKKLYLTSVGGLITEAYVVHGPSPSEDLLYSAEVFYTATASPRRDLGLSLGYVARLLGLKRGQESMLPLSDTELEEEQPLCQKPPAP
ncbi:MAG TPA: NDP-sugar synthase [Verrucomicrobiae bacterium]|nr:NDP-sugar synthase [Verrucomicrobiae bacterium]